MQQPAEPARHEYAAVLAPRKSDNVRLHVHANPVSLVIAADGLYKRDVFRTLLVRFLLSSSSQGY